MSKCSLFEHMLIALSIHMLSPGALSGKILKGVIKRHRDCELRLCAGPQRPQREIFRGR
jgi:hypothetical protein